MKTSIIVCCAAFLALCAPPETATGQDRDETAVQIEFPILGQRQRAKLEKLGATLGDRQPIVASLGTASVRVFDFLGREVNAVTQALVAVPNRVSIPELANSGLYLVRLSIGGLHRTFQLTVLID